VAGTHAYIRLTAKLAATEKRMASMLISRLIRLVRAWWRYNESVRELARLNDRELADIGISRSEIGRIAWDNARTA
jgi:uncharacterized protein YjiS (DUF1127 family)